MSWTLRAKHEAGGWRHYLNGEPIHCGDSIELHLRDGTWLRGRYEASGFQEIDGPRSTFHFPIYAAGLDADDATAPAAEARFTIWASRMRFRFPPSDDSVDGAKPGFRYHPSGRPAIGWAK